MFGKILAAVVGAKAAENTKVGGAGGALIGVAATTLLRRLSLPVLIGVTAAGYALKKRSDRREAEPAPAPEPKKRAGRPRKTTATSA